MKLPATTTKAEAAPGNAIERRISSTSNANLTPRTSSSHHDETTDFDLPTYNISEVCTPEEKDGRREDGYGFTGSLPSEVPETEPLRNIQYPQMLQSSPENSNFTIEQSTCALLPNRPAVWLVKASDLKISSLAAAVLLNDGICTAKDLALWVLPFLITLITTQPRS